MTQELLQAVTDSEIRDLNKAVTKYQTALHDGDHDHVLKYLIEDRGLTEETVTTFRLGVVADPLPGHGAQVGNLVIPYLSARHHDPLTLKFRCVRADCDHKANKHGKYGGLPHARSRLFNTSAVVQASLNIHITEGEFDAMTLDQIGYYSVGVPGATSWRPHYRYVFAGFQRIYVWGDPDDAGATFAAQVCSELPRAVSVRLPKEYGDVNAAVMAGGEDVVIEAMEDALGVKYA